MQGDLSRLEELVVILSGEVLGLDQVLDVAYLVPSFSRDGRTSILKQLIRLAIDLGYHLILLLAARLLLNGCIRELDNVRATHTIRVLNHGVVGSLGVFWCCTAAASIFRRHTWLMPQEAVIFFNLTLVLRLLTTGPRGVLNSLDFRNLEHFLRSLLGFR